MIFGGGIGRLISMLALALPPIPFIAFTALEVVGAPPHRPLAETGGEAI